MPHQPFFRKILWVCAGLVYLLGVLIPGNAAGAGDVSGIQPAERPGLHQRIRNQDEGSFSVYFLPQMMRQLCSGDMIHLRFVVQYNSPEPDLDDELPLAPLVPHVPLVPLDVKMVRVFTRLGDASPVEFPLIAPHQVFSFKYTAGEPGLETIRVEVGDGVAFAEKTIQVREACDYDLSIFILAREQGEGGAYGFTALFSGNGYIGLDRTSAGSNKLVGQGTDRFSLQLWAQAEDAFSCKHEPITGRSRFNIDGYLTPPPLAAMHISLDFEPMTTPTNWEWICQAAGMEDITLNIPLSGEAGDLNEYGLNDVLFSANGGVHHFSAGSDSGILTVTPK
jgi:hypothetical protein